MTMMQATETNKPIKGRIVVSGILFSFSVAGVIWQHLQLLVGLRRLGYEVTYLEWADNYPNDYSGEAFPDMERHVDRVAALLERFGLAGHWMFGMTWEERSWGMEGEVAKQALRTADAFINLCGTHMPNEDHLLCPRRIMLETDPVEMQIRLAKHDPYVRGLLDQYTTLFTYGENIGTPICPLSAGGYTWHPTRQVVLLDAWQAADPPATDAPYTTVGNWDVVGKDIEVDGVVYHWQKGLEFLKVRELPRRVSASFLLAMRFGDMADKEMMEACGWRTRPALEVSLDIDIYRAFIQGSRGEYTVAKEQNIVFQSGWFSDRASTYLAAGRPVINQDTGFAYNLPTGEGLFSFRDLDESIAAVQCIEADYARHSRAATEIARAYFNYDVVLPRLLTLSGLEA